LIYGNSSENSAQTENNVRTDPVEKRLRGGNKRIVTENIGKVGAAVPGDDGFKQLADGGFVIDVDAANLRAGVDRVFDVHERNLMISEPYRWGKYQNE
jgi:hypothetical protein